MRLPVLFMPLLWWRIARASMLFYDRRVCSVCRAALADVRCTFPFWLSLLRRTARAPMSNIVMPARCAIVMLSVAYDFTVDRVCPVCRAALADVRCTFPFWLSLLRRTARAPMSNIVMSARCAIVMLSVDYGFTVDRVCPVCRAALADIRCTFPFWLSLLRRHVFCVVPARIVGEGADA